MALSGTHKPCMTERSRGARSHSVETNKVKLSRDQFPETAIVFFFEKPLITVVDSPLKHEGVSNKRFHLMKADVIREC